MRAVIVVAALGLAGCQPQAQEAQAPAAPPAVDASTVAPQPPQAIGVTDFSEPMMARGNEPFWAVRMDGKSFTLLRPEQPELSFTAPGAQISPGKGLWQAKAADGQTLVVTLYVSECNDGMSDIRYPFTAEVEFAGETLRGCAAKQSQLAREPAR